MAYLIVIKTKIIIKKEDELRTYVKIIFKIVFVVIFPTCSLDEIAFKSYFGSLPPHPAL